MAIVLAIVGALVNRMRARKRTPASLEDPMNEIVALYSVIGVILLSALSLGAVVAHAL
jgi:hypothetical protein